MEKTIDSNRITRDFDLPSMSREELEALLVQIDGELDARAFENSLRRQLDYHLRKQSWPNQRNGGGRYRF
ncbi:MAG: hypothetical protein L0H73_05205 [Nitrococcus sp.]|nr:hypothetical protein [Nitrococcus sp.]